MTQEGKNKREDEEGENEGKDAAAGANDRGGNVL